MLGLGILLIAVLHGITICKGELQDTTASGNYVFQMFTEEGLYPEQKTFCESKGGWPAEPQTEQLNNDLSEILDSNNGTTRKGYFIGLVQRNGVWKWQRDNTTVSYSNWKSEEESRGATKKGHSCNIHAVIRDSGKWEDRWGGGPPSECDGARIRRFACQYDNYCTPDPCQNEGTCVFTTDNTAYYRCDCAAGYNGVHCENDHCTSNPCQHGGTCRHTTESYICDCMAGYHGKDCASDYCASNPCQNGGTCMPMNPMNHPYYKCTCVTGINGDNCEGELHNSIVSGDYVFQTFTDEGLYPDAKAFCEGKGGWPGEPRNKRLNNDLVKIVDSSRYFIGLVHEDGEWKWQSHKIKAFYTNWNTGEGSANDACTIYAVITDTGTWEDRWGRSMSTCNNPIKRRFVCQFDAVTATHNGLLYVSISNNPV